MKFIRNKEKEFVFLVFIITTILHCIIAMQDKVLLIYPDELAYLDPARSFIRDGVFSIHYINENWEPILYSVLLAPYTLIEDSYIQIKVLYVVNCIIMCSSIFPCYILCRKIIFDKKNRLLAVVFMALIPEFAMTRYFMAENLFFPLSMWLFVVIYRYLEEENKKKKKILMAGIAVLCFCLYITKSIALGYCIGIAAMLLYDTIFEKKWENYKENFINLIIFGGGSLILIVLFKYYITVTADVMGTIYDTRGELPLRNIKEILFLFFCVASYVVYTLIGFFFFPAAIPGAKFKSLKNADRKLYVFTVTALLSMCCAVALICNIREDALEESIRIHMRFYAPLSIPFILLLLSFSKVEFSKMEKRIYGGISVVSVILMLIVLRTPKFGCNLDGWMLFTYKSILYKICEYFQVNATHGWPVILVMFLIVALILAITSIGLRRGYNIKNIVIVILLLVMMEDLYITIYEYRYNERFQDGIEDARLLNEFFCDVDGNILVISKEGDGYVTENVLDTYLSKAHFTVGYNDVNNLWNENKGIWAISEKTISAHYPWHNYYNLNQVDYIILDSENNIKLDKSNLEPVYIEGVEDFLVYKNLDPDYLCKEMVNLEIEELSIDFSDDGNAAEYIISGWHGQEEEAIWSGQEALLQYDAFISSDFEIKILCGTLIDEPEIMFYVDGIAVQSKDVIRTEDGYRIYVGEDGFNSDIISHSILIRDENVFSPSQVWDDNNDERLLSLCVREIIIYDK